MPTCPRRSGKSHPASPVMAITGAVLALALSACADTNWERAIYQGWQHNQRSCRMPPRASDPPCVNLPPYEAYVKERDAVRGKPTPNASRNDAAN